MKSPVFLFITVSIVLSSNSFAVAKPSKYVTFIGNFPAQYRLQASSDFFSTNPDCLYEGLGDVVTGSGPQPREKRFNEDAKVESSNDGLSTFSLQVPFKYGVEDS